MKAIVARSYGGPEVLRIEEVPTPTPKNHEVLIKINATSVTTASTIMRTGKPYFGRLFLGFFKPKNAVQGTDLTGEIVQTGKEVTKFKAGDKVMAETGIHCGAYAEYICLSENDLIVKQPANMSPAEATGMLDGGTTALSFFTDSIRLKKGWKVLINGASGSIGTAAVQLAKNAGAEVTGVCSGKNKKLVLSLGADHVIDYTKEDFTQHAQQYDVIFDTVGKLSFKKSKRVLCKQGRFLTPVLTMNVLGQWLISSLFGRKKLKFAATGMRKEDLRMRDLLTLKKLAESGKFKTVIDRTYPIGEIQKAHEYVEQGHKRGNVVLFLHP